MNLRARLCLALLALVAGFSQLAIADGPADNIPANVRRIPKIGVEVPADVRDELERGLKALKTQIDAHARMNNPQTRQLLPDVEIYYKAVHDALKYQEFFDVKEFAIARSWIQHGLDRAGLMIGNPPGCEPRGRWCADIAQKLTVPFSLSDSLFLIPTIPMDLPVTESTSGSMVAAKSCQSWPL